MKRVLDAPTVGPARQREQAMAIEREEIERGQCGFGFFGWGNVTLALAGPALVAVLGARFAPSPVMLSTHVIGLLAIVLITLSVYAWAMFGEGYALQHLGYGQYSWLTPLLAVPLTAFFVLIFGPIAYWVLARSGFQSFDNGIEAVSQLPTAYLDDRYRRAAEELLYRGYAIRRLFDLTGSYVLASIVSVVAFGLAHVPMWGWAPAIASLASRTA